MAYLVLAYPEVRDEDFKQIQDYRKNNDELYFKVVILILLLSFQYLMF